MMTNSREKGIEAKQEGEANENKKFAKAPSTSSRQWSAFRNPRIVRVSRTFGGKDRHSKVCTVRGLRDRRIRLSVPTAIQLYDLQDRLGLSQPSKVIDWLIDATKNDIDKLPPLQLPQGFGNQFHQQMLFSNEFMNSSSSSHHHNQSSHFSPFLDTNSSFFNKDNIGFHSLGIRVNNNSSNLDGGDDQNVTMAKARYWEGGESSNVNDKGKWIKIHDQDNQAQKLFPLVSSSNMLNNPISYNSYNYHCDASNLSLSQFGTNNNSQSHHGFTTQNENSQLFLYPPTNVPSYFSQYPSYNLSMENNESTRETNHFQWLTSSSSGANNNPLKNFSLNVNPGHHHHSQRSDNGSHTDKDES